MSEIERLAYEVACVASELSSVGTRVRWEAGHYDAARRIEDAVDTLKRLVGPYMDASHKALK